MRASRENAKPTLLRRALACLVSAAMVVAFTPAAAFAVDPSSGVYEEKVSCDVKPGQYFYLKVDYFTHGDYERYRFNLVSKTIKGEKGVINEVIPSDTRFKFLAECCGTAQVELVFSASDGPQHLRITYEIKVSPYEITLTPNSKSGIYDGTEKSVSGFENLNSTIRSEGVTSLSGPFQSETYSDTFKVSGLTAQAKGTDADEYLVNVSGQAVVTNSTGNDVTDWCKVSCANAKLAIAQRPVTLTSADASKEYDGKPLTNHEVTVGGDGWVNGQGATYSFTGSQETVGFSENVFECIPNEGTNLGNYKITKQYGILTVTKQPTITFDTDDGTAIAPITQHSGKALSLPTPEKSGYSFGGWYSDPTLATKYNGTTMPAKDITLYAKWTINQYTITFEPNGGTAVGSIKQNYGSALSLPDPTKENYDFGGWYSDSGLTAQYTGTTMPAENKTLYAKWTGKQYNLTLDANGGTINSGNVTSYTYGVGATLPTNVTKSGYTFAGWYDSNKQKVTEIAADSTGDVALTAKWNYVPPSDPSYNVPASDEGSVAVRVTVSGSTAVVAEISASALESAAGSGAASITIDLSGLPKGVTQAQLSKSTVDKLLAVVMNAGNAVESVTVNLGGAVLVIDDKALAAIVGQMKGANVTLGVRESTADSLNSAQKKALSSFTVVQLYFTAEIKSGGAKIHDFGGGSVRVSVAFAPKPGHNPARYVVLYAGEDGSIERYATAWAGGMLSFTAPHFSTYAVVYVEDATQAAIDALEAAPVVGELKASQAKEAVKKAQSALKQVAALDDGQKMLVDEALVANAESVVVKGAKLVATADKKAVGKVKDKAFSVKAGKSKSIAFKTKMSVAGTKVVYKKAKGSKYISVTKSGKVTAKKGLKPGKTYTAKVKVTCGASSKTVKVTVRVQ